ncbi:non-canonical purine NTP pyrophosphatase [Pseudoalteromonas umbrosa]|uniref:non-canonical purine NTP pyrophosphatase n=1 Tax=Pseudoalteromonas umbrosa TaxID=3048489 RepID=UPI0024C3F258|nr:non-canonical purine NTP pyrophosphatase [Pseudoalteromonas sp. B95]MDK1286870.1 non-canonical purine NTP pyrophosphatase [Pseudoalteromonas sp. B95]
MIEHAAFDEIVIASHNLGKTREISALIKPYCHKVHCAHALGLDEIEETGTSFCQNAQLKALNIAKQSGKVAIADDSGLCIDALNGLPGLYTARWAKQAGGYNGAIEHVLTRMALTQKRHAKMVCALSLAYPSGDVCSFVGELPGTISWRASGQNHIGFEPIFIPHGHNSTLASLPTEKRNTLHPRASAFKLLKEHIFCKPAITLHQPHSEEVRHATV